MIYLVKIPIACESDRDCFFIYISKTKIYSFTPQMYDFLLVLPNILKLFKKIILSVNQI